MVYGLFMFGAYFSCAIFIHLAYNRMTTIAHDDHGSKHYVLYTLNDQPQIEWIIRSLILFYWLQGKSITITVIDEGSSDDTLAIIDLLSRQHHIDIRHIDDEQRPLPPRDTSVHIRLSQPEDLHKLPQVHSLW